jgi:hypothetical protein
MCRPRPRVQPVTPSQRAVNAVRQTAYSGQHARTCPRWRGGHRSTVRVAAAGLTPQGPGTPARPGYSRPARVLPPGPGSGLLTCLVVIEAAVGAPPRPPEDLVLGLLLLALVLWIALGLDRSRRHRLHDQGPILAGPHRHRAAPRHRRLRRGGVSRAPLTQPVCRPVFQGGSRVRRGAWQDSLIPAFRERFGTEQRAMG